MPDKDAGPYAICETRDDRILQPVHTRPDWGSAVALAAALVMDWEDGGQEWGEVVELLDDCGGYLHPNLGSLDVQIVQLIPCWS